MLQLNSIILQLITSVELHSPDGQGWKGKGCSLGTGKAELTPKLHVVSLLSSHSKYIRCINPVEVGQVGIQLMYLPHRVKQI